MYKEAAEKFAKELEEELGSDYTVEELLRYQTKMGLITPSLLDDYNIKNQFEERQEAQKHLPLKQRKSNTKIADDLAAENNCSLSRIFNIVRYSY